MLRKIMMVMIAASALTGRLTADALALPNMPHLHSTAGGTSLSDGPFSEFSAHGIGQSDARSRAATEFYGEDALTFRRPFDSRIGGYERRPYLLENPAGRAN